MAEQKHPPTSHEIALSEAEEKLLLMYLDGEASLLGRWKVKRLLKCSSAAQLFVEEMNRASIGFKEYVLERHLGGENSREKGIRQFDEVSRWAQLEQRLILEQPHAVRNQNSSTLWERWSEALQLLAFDREGFARVRWAASGAVLSACMIVAGSAFEAVTPVSESLSGAQLSGMQLSGLSPEEGGSAAPKFVSRTFGENRRAAGTLREVSSSRERISPEAAFLGSSDGEVDLSQLMSQIQRPTGRMQSAPVNPAYEAPRLLPDRRIQRTVPRALEVDWMRSRGRVRVMEDPEERASIIWVNPARSYMGAMDSRRMGNQLRFDSPPSAIAVSSGAMSTGSVASLPAYREDFAASEVGR